MALYEQLTATSSPEEIAAAYREFTGSVGGDTKDAQTRAVDYLSNLGIAAPTIEQAYSQYTQPATGALNQATTASATTDDYDFSTNLGQYKAIKTGNKDLIAQALAANTKGDVYDRSYLTSVLGKEFADAYFAPPAEVTTGLPVETTETTGALTQAVGSTPTAAEIANMPGVGTQGIGISIPGLDAATLGIWTPPKLAAVEQIAPDSEFRYATFYNPNDGKTYGSMADAEAVNTKIVNDAKKTALADAWTEAQTSDDYTQLANLIANTNTTGYDLYTMFGLTPAQQAEVAAKTGRSLTPDVITDYRGKTYDTETVLNLANQLAGIADTSRFSGGVYGVTKGSVGFDYEQGARAIGRDINAAEQVLLDAARHLIDEGITDISKLGMGDIKSTVTVRPQTDENGAPTGDYVALIPSGTDNDGGTQYTTRILTPEEVIRIRSVENAASGDNDAYTSRFLDDVVTGKGLVYDGKNRGEGSYLNAGYTATGKGGTSYQIVYDDKGQPHFTTTAESSSALGMLSPFLAIASFIPGVAPFAMAANAAIAIDQGNVLGALASLAGMGGYTNLATGLNVANAVDKKDVGALAGALLSNPTISNAAGTTMLTDTISFADLGNAANLAINIDNGNWAGALNSVGALTGSSDARVAASALTIATELGKDNPNFSAVINAAQTINNATSSASSNVSADVVGGITNRVVDDLSTQSGGTDLGSSAYVAAINAGANEEEALAAANAVSGTTNTVAGADDNGVVINKIADSGPNTSIITTPDTEFGDLDGAIAQQIRNTEVDRLATAYETTTGKTLDKLTDTEMASLYLAVNSLTTDQLKNASIQDILNDAPKIVSKDDQGRWVDDKGYAYDDKGFKYAPGSDRPIVEVRGVGITGTPTAAQSLDAAGTNLVNWANTLEGTSGDVVRQTLSTLIGASGEQVADLSTALANMGMADRYNLLVQLGQSLERTGGNLEIPGVTEATQNFWNDIQGAETYAGKVAAALKSVVNNPLVLTQVAKEGFQEILPIVTGGAVFKLVGKTAGIATDVLMNASESMGSQSRQKFNEEIAKGTPPEEAQALANADGWKAFAITAVTAGLADAALVKGYEKAMDKLFGKTATSLGKEWGEEGFEELAIALATGDDLPTALSKSVAGSAIGSKTSGTLTAGSSVSADIQQAFASEGLTSTDGTFRPETIVKADGTAGSGDTAGTTGAADVTGVTGAEVLTGGASADTTAASDFSTILNATGNTTQAIDTSVGTAISNGADVGSTITSVVGAANNTGASVNVAAATAANAAVVAGADATTASNAATTAVSNVTTGVTTGTGTGATTGVTTGTGTGATTGVTTGTGTGATTGVTTGTGTGATTGVTTGTGTGATTGVTTGTGTGATTGVTTGTGTEGNTNTFTGANNNTSTNAATGVTTGTTVDANTGTATTTTTNTNTGTSTTVSTNTNTGVTTTTNTNINTGVDTSTTTNTSTNVTTSTVTDTNTGSTVIINTDTDTGDVIDVDTGGTDSTVIDSDTIDLGDGVVVDISTGETLTPEEVEERKKKTKIAVPKTAKKPSGLLAGASGTTAPYKPSDISETWLGGQFRNLAPFAALAGLLPENNPMFQEQQSLSALRRASGLDDKTEKPDTDYFSYGSEPSVASVLAPYKRGGGVQDPTGGGKIMTSPLMAASGGDVEHKGSHYVQGAGGGQDDLIPAKLADGEYVFDAEIVAALGDGSNKEGARKLDEFREAIRRHKRSGSTKTIPPKAKSPLAYMKGIK